MSCRVDTTPLISGACVVSLYDGHGITGAAMRAATATGPNGPGLMYNDWDNSGDDAKEFRSLLVTPPASGTFTINEDGSFSLTGAPDGSYSVVYRLFVDGADLGTATASITIGAVGSVSASSSITMGAFTGAAVASIPVRAAAAGVMGAFTTQATATSGVVAQCALTMGAFTSQATASITGDVVELVTLAQVQQYLMMALGVELPTFLVQAALAKTAPYAQALADAGYEHSEQVMIMCISTALIAAAGLPRRLTSQHAPSGAARSFKYSDRDLWALRRSLAALDSAGVMTACVGPDPTAVGMFMVV